MAKYLITGTAGFIGFHLACKLLPEGYDIIGLDNINSYYDLRLKLDRLKILQEYPNFTFYEVSLEDSEAMERIFLDNDIDKVIHLAAQAGVRYSLENPRAYVDSNIVGFLNILEACRRQKTKHLIFASSSSVYGANKKIPYSVHDKVDHPLSLYAATKKSNELMAHAYSHLYGIPVTGLRFFTVYGPWGRPDMAPFLFTKAIIDKEPIKVFNFGNMKRDFTYIDDAVEGIIRLIEKIPEAETSWSGEAPDKGSGGEEHDSGSGKAPYKIYNIGNNNPVGIEEFISVLEDKLGRKAVKEYLPMQPGDVPVTFADIDDLKRDTGFKPETSIQEGVERFVKWYMQYYKIW